MRSGAPTETLPLLYQLASRIPKSELLNNRELYLQFQDMPILLTFPEVHQAHAAYDIRYFRILQKTIYINEKEIYIKKKRDEKERYIEEKIKKKNETLKTNNQMQIKSTRLSIRVL